MTEKLPEPLGKAVKATLEDWKANNKVERLWAADASLWTNTDEGKWLGWLRIVEEQLAKRQSFQQIAEEIRAAGFTHAVLLGMGGSSLCVEVLELTFGKIGSYPKMSTLDSTDPAQIKSVESKVDLAKTVFIVSSKSGSTLEPNIFKEYFYERVNRGCGRGRGRQTLHCRHGSWFEYAESGGGERISACLFRTALDRWTVFGAFGFRSDSWLDTGN